MTTTTRNPDRVDRIARRLVQQGMVADPDEAEARARETAAEADERTRQYEQEVLQREREADESRWRKRVPRRFHDARVGDLDGSAAAAIAAWRQDPTRNLVLLGGVGTGKTHAAVAALRLAHEAGHWVEFWPVVKLLDQLRPGGDDSALERALTVDFLLLDDFGTERPTDWTAERLYMVVAERWNQCRPIIATSNLAAANGRGPLVDAIGERLYSRLIDHAVVYQLAGDDRRRSTSAPRDTANEGAAGDARRL